MSTYTPAELQQAARDYWATSGNEALSLALPLMLPDSLSNATLRAYIPIVSGAVGRNVTPYRVDGSLDHEKFPNGINLAPYLRSVLRRWAARN